MAANRKGKRWGTRSSLDATLREESLLRKRKDHKLSRGKRKSRSVMAVAIRWDGSRPWNWRKMTSGEAHCLAVLAPPRKGKGRRKGRGTGKEGGIPTAAAYPRPTVRSGYTEWRQAREKVSQIPLTGRSRKPLGGYSSPGKRRKPGRGGFHKD